MLLLVSMLLQAQGPEAASDPAYATLSSAYQALQSKQYDAAIELFLKAIGQAPGRAAIRKDLAYAYLKVGENEAARDQFAQAMSLDPADFHVALEYAYLCHDTGMKAAARRVFDRVRKTGDPPSRATAEQAFRNIDGPLAAGIERWTKALELVPASFSAHHELATLAEQRDDLELAARHYQRAWEILPARRQTLLDLGRTWKALNRVDEANAALLAAAWGSEPRAREAARELLPDRYPYVQEFRRTLELDSGNIDLRRELAFLLLAMDRQPEAEREFLIVLEKAPDDLLSCAQMGFLYLVRDEKSRAMPLLEKVLKSNDVSLANRVRAALKMPLLDAAGGAVSEDPKVMAERSLKSGYLKDALQYLHAAHRADPADGWVSLKLGSTYNILHLDQEASRWFSLARRSPDAAIAADADRSFRNLRAALKRFRTTLWLYPLYSSRWHDVFAYGQIKTEVKLGNLPFRPYVSLRLFGDTRLTTGGPIPQYLSESAGLFAVGVAARSWRGMTLWGEAGTAVSYVDRRPQSRTTADYRGGLSFGRGFGHGMGGESPGWFFETNADALYFSRFENDFLLYGQTRIGLTPPPLGSIETQLFWNNNLVRDAKGLDWANFIETGPGVRFRWQWMPRPLVFSVSGVRGYHLSSQYYRRADFLDVRAGFWYAITR
ncbi:MAG TPA: tetratricopeptide repeat protein [Bryobacteraceae bacterium]|nr:tetratricopeptide repeat protein [Bryobacteraceae bacterium]